MALLETQHLCRNFGGLKAIDDISMSVDEKEVLGIIGPNGAGKTTFFNLITGTIPSSSGRILYEGKDVTQKTPETMASLGMARTFQNIKLFKYLSVLENVKTGFHMQTSTGIFSAVLHNNRYRQDEKLASEKGMEILRKVGLADQAELMAGNLPYGWQRRLEIARALAIDPKILLLDEPAAGMNPSETKELMELIRTLNEDGITIVVIEHDMKFIMNLCERIIVINSGKKLSEGTPDEITHNEEVIEAYLGKGLSVHREQGGTRHE